MKRTTLFVTILAMLFAAATLSAFSGHITSNTVWSEDIIITGDTWVDAGATLTIDAGVTVSFTKIDADNNGKGDTDFFVDGRLLCNGAESNPVVFTSNEADPAPADWKGLSFRNTTAIHSNLTNTEVYYGDNGVYVSAKFVDFTDCVIAYNYSDGLYIVSSHDGLVTIDGMVVYENNMTGVDILTNGQLSAIGLVSSSNMYHGLASHSDDVIVGDSKFVSNWAAGIFTTGDITVTNSDISNNIAGGVCVEGGAPDFSYCTVSNNDCYGFVFDDGATGLVTYSDIIDNSRAGFFVYEGSLPVINYNNIHGNAYDDSELKIYETVPSGSLYLSTEGTSSTYSTIMPVNLMSALHVSGYGDHDGSSDDYYFRVYSGNGSQLYSYEHYNTSYDTSFDQWVSVSNSSTSMGLYIYLDVYSLYSYWGRVTEIEYNIGGLQNELVTANASGEINAMYNWWGTVNGVDDLVYQSVASTVDYEGLQVAPVATAGATLPNDAPIFEVVTPDSMIINPTNYTIEWYDVDVDNDAQIDLYCTPEIGVPGTLIAGGISEDLSSDTFVWSFDGVPHDIYYIYGVCDDGVNTPVESYAPGRVQVGPLSAGAPLDAHGEAGLATQIPIEIVNSWDYYGIVSFQFMLTYDQTLLTATGVSTSGTLSENWTVNHNADSPGQIQVNGFTTTPLTTDGVLVNIDFNVAAGANDYEASALTFVEWTFNDGSATVVQNDGAFTVLNRYLIGGDVDYYSTALPVDDIMLHLEGPEVDSTVTATGAYAFSSHLAGDYDLTPTCTEAIPALTVTPYDASLTARYALGLITFDANQETAADVNDDDTPTVYDASLMAQYSVGLITEFDAGAWAFTPLMHSFELVGGPADKDFSAIVIGDPSGNWPGGAERTIPELWGPPVVTRTGEDYVGLTVHYDDPFFSFNTAVGYDAEAVEFVEARLGDNLEGFQLAVNDNNGVVRAGGFATQQAQTSAGAVTLMFHVIDHAQLEDAFHIDYITFDEQFGGYVNTVATDDPGLAPAMTLLGGNFPNPFNPMTTVSFSLSEAQHVTVEVFNVRGQRVSTLVDEYRNAGEHRVTWNAEGQSSGVYFCRMRAGADSDVKKMLLVK